MDRDKRVGQGNEWPEVDMNGQPYSRPATVASVGEERFVVIPMNFVRWDEVEALKSAKPVAPVAAKDTKKGSE